MMHIKSIKYKSSEKMVIDRTNKEKDFLQFGDLKCYTKHQMEVMKLQSVYQFKQSTRLLRKKFSL